MTEFEYRAKPDEIINLGNGNVTNGWRVQYRRPGVRRWTRFLLVEEKFPDAAATEAMLLAHEEIATGAIFRAEMAR